MPETIPADITAAIDNFHLRALREGRLGTGTVAASDAASAASEARKRLEAAIMARIYGHAALKAALEVQTSGAA